MITRNGVYYDLKQSRYKVHCSGGLLLYFSSDLHMLKFLDKKEAHRKEINDKMTSRFRIEIRLNTLADIILYQKIETRGFYITDEKGNELCRENLILSGERPTLKS
jgi:hypothetical protein